MTPRKKVLIIGGTHGNEWTGIVTVKKYSDFFKTKFQNLDLHFVVANPEAYRLNLRFKDEDLNRAFQYLHEDRPDSYEHCRAKEIKAMIQEGPCFVLDLHTTTANMGNTVILTHNYPLNCMVSSQLVQNLPQTKVILSPDPHKKYLASQSDLGMMIEVGPVANGVIDARALEATLQLIEEVLKALSHEASLSATPLEIYEEIEDVFYPQNEVGELTGYIHGDFQGKDFSPIEGAYLPFKAFSGESLPRQTQEELYPIFINEAAYYPKGLAYTLCRKRTLIY
jgi:aspartoacylase